MNSLFSRAQVTDRPTSPFDSQQTRRGVLRLGALGLGAIATGPLLSACGDGNSPSPSAGPTGKPVKGGTLRVALPGGGSSETLDPRNAISTAETSRVKQVYETLTRLDKDGKLTNWLAEELTPNATADSWTIRLRPDVVFHDGKALTADDVIYSMRYSQEGGVLAGDVFASIDLAGLKKVDDLTVQVPLKAPNGFLAEVLSDNFAGIYRDGTTDFSAPNGTGPFSFEEWKAGSQGTYSRFDGYWRDPALLDAIVLSSLDDADARVNALAGGQIDFATGVPFTQVDAVKANSKLTLYDTPSAAFGAVYMWTDDGALADPRVRQALRLLVDRDQVVSNAFGGHAKVGNDLSSWFDGNYASDLPQREYDPDQAASLLKAAGQEDLHLSLSTSDVFEGLLATTTLMAASAKKAGVTIELKQDPSDSYYSKTYQNVPFGVTNWYARTLASYLAKAVGPGISINETHFHDAEFDSVYASAFQESDEAKRRTLLQDAQQILYERGGYVIPAFPNWLEASSAKVGGISTGIAFELDTFNFSGTWIQA